jgi:hypothetical protein
VKSTSNAAAADDNKSWYVSDVPLRQNSDLSPTSPRLDFPRINRSLITLLAFQVEHPLSMGDHAHRPRHRLQRHRRRRRLAQASLRRQAPGPVSRGKCSQFRRPGRKPHLQLEFGGLESPSAGLGVLPGP